MLVHLLSLFDALAAVVIFLGHFGLVHTPLLYAALYLIVKLFFFRDVLSIIDTAAALYAVYLYFTGAGVGITWLFMIFFGYKVSVWLFYTFAE
jgi:hypothetical protein